MNEGPSVVHFLSIVSVLSKAFAARNLLQVSLVDIKVIMEVINIAVWVWYRRQYLVAEVSCIHFLFSTAIERGPWLYRNPVP